MGCICESPKCVGIHKPGKCIRTDTEGTPFCNACVARDEGLRGVGVFEIVTFDPEDHDTYPSVCQVADEVRDRFGFVGGEKLLFDDRGNYVGQLVKTLSD